MISLKQLQDAITQLADEHEVVLDSEEARSVESDLTHLRQRLQSLTKFRENILRKTQLHTDEDIYQFLDQSHEKQGKRSHSHLLPRSLFPSRCRDANRREQRSFHSNSRTLAN